MKTLRHPFVLSLVVALGGCIADANQPAIEHFAKTTQALGWMNLDASFSLNGMTTTIQTGEMPAVWFVSDTNVTQLTVNWTIPATKCKPAALGTFGSPSVGAFQEVLDANGNVTGYSWSATHDLAGLENHWHNLIACDGSSTVVGCQPARTVAYSMSVVGGCLLTDSSCTTFGSVSLGSIQDVDEFEPNCPTTCEASLGVCISACQSACPSGDSGCGRCCECDCKDAIREQNPSCKAPQASCYVAKPNRPACL